METIVIAKEFMISESVANKKLSRVTNLLHSFEVGELVLTLPFSKGTVIVKYDDYYAIQTDTDNIREIEVKKMGKNSRYINVPRWDNNPILICKFVELPRTTGSFREYKRVYVYKPSSVAVKIPREWMNDKVSVIPYVENLTEIIENDDGFDIVTYSPNIITDYPTVWVDNIVVKVPTSWNGDEVLLIRR